MGRKAECSECGARFYDLKRNPIICPKCETPFVVPVEKGPSPPAAAPPPERVRPAPVEQSAGTASEAKDDDAGDLADIEIDDADDSDDKDDNPIEDAAELGESDDMSDVIDGAIDGSKADQ